jgi:single-strand DNA-binding protein
MASDINNVILTGRLTRDPELKATPSGKYIGKCGIAVSKYRKTNEGFKEETSFFNIQAWGYTAQSLAKISKGSLVALGGELIQDRWQDSDGKNRSAVTINVQSLQTWKKEKAPF